MPVFNHVRNKKTTGKERKGKDDDLNKHDSSQPAKGIQANKQNGKDNEHETDCLHRVPPALLILGVYRGCLGDASTFFCVFFC